jgi:hypothetical protein
MNPRRNSGKIRRAAGHRCPQCRSLWALAAVRNDSGFVVLCRYCDYLRPVGLQGTAWAGPKRDSVTA